jgi:hypothetical protein
VASSPVPVPRLRSVRQSGSANYILRL